jgi:FKBP-type peptidyl-prolyl cis-trans isomerase 2
LPVKKGDFITLNYTCKIKETNEIVESTKEIKRQSLEKQEEKIYEPKLVVVGEEIIPKGWVPKGLDESLEGTETGKNFKIEVSSEKGYGERDQSKVRLYPLRRFTREGIRPAPGMQIQVDGRQATVRSVGAGRVQIDFNHPLAGKTLIYEATVEKLLKERAEKVKALIHRRIPNLKLDKLGLTVSQKSVAIEIPEDSFFIEGLQYAKRQIASEIQKHLLGTIEVSYVERFKKPEEVKKIKPEAKTKQKQKPKAKIKAKSKQEPKSKSKRKKEKKEA